jgi:hypothetical protein
VGGSLMVLGRTVNFFFEYADKIQAERLRNQKQEIEESDLQKNVLHNETIVVLNANREYIGYLEWGFFWNEIPFINKIIINTDYRKQGCGKNLHLFWEGEMKKRGHNLLLTASSNNRAEFHFFLKMSYLVCGSFLIDNSMLQIMLSKKI